MLRFDQVAQLRVPLASGRTRVGSGFLLAERLVLTAAHVLKGARPDATIEVALPYAEASATGAMAWQGAAGLDAA